MTDDGIGPKVDHVRFVFSGLIDEATFQITARIRVLSAPHAKPTNLTPTLVRLYTLSPHTYSEGCKRENLSLTLTHIPIQIIIN